MQYNIKASGVSASDEVRGYVEKKLAVLEKFVSDPTVVRADVELNYLESEEKNYRAEFAIFDPALPEAARTEARGQALHEAIDLCVSELQEELTRKKKKRIDLVRRTAVRVKEYLRGWRSKI